MTHTNIGRYVSGKGYFGHGAARPLSVGCHGAAQALNRVFKRQWENLHTAFRWMATFLFVNLTWVIFRSESISQAKLFLKRLLDFGNMQINPSFMDSFKMVELPLWLTGHRVFTVLGLYGIVLCLVMNARNMGRQSFAHLPSWAGQPSSGLVRPVSGWEYPASFIYSS